MPICRIDARSIGGRYHQQELHYCTPILHPGIIIGAFSIIVLVAGISGVVFMLQSHNLFHAEYASHNGHTLEINITHEQANKIRVDRPVYLYYKLPYYYQNVRTYVESVNYTQLRQQDPIPLTAECTSYTDTNIPCSIMWESMPEVDLSAMQGAVELNVSTTGMAWEADRDRTTMFGPGFKGLRDAERAMTWFRQSPYENVTKPLGHFYASGTEDDIQLRFSFRQNNSVSYMDGGMSVTKRAPGQTDNVSLILAQTGPLGAREETRAVAVMCLVAGGMGLLCSITLAVLWCSVGERSKLYYRSIDTPRGSGDAGEQGEAGPGPGRQDSALHPV